MPGIEGLLLGRLLGDRYRIEEVIGRGGMGAVYRATDERLGRQVAVKVITVSGAADGDSRERLRARFLREARAAAGLPHHPNVVPVYDYGSDPTLGLDYLVMELLRGSDLATHLARAGTLPLSTGLRILYEAARGLAVGHRAGLIHRDVKPGNIFLADTGPEEIQVRVVDFGIAKLVDDEDTASQLTQEGRAPHSPAFASPEQLRGLSNLTPASDVFSLGAVGYQLLTGQRPFSDADRNRMSLGMPVEAPPPRSINPAIPEPAEAIVRKALSFEPADRFPDAGAMAGALDQALRSLSDLPLAPYAGGSPLTVVHPPAQPTEADHTRLMDEEDDRTLLAPPAAAPAAAPARKRPPHKGPPPPRVRRPPPPPERGVGGIIVWTLVVLLLAGAGFWIWSTMQPPPPQIATELPPQPEEIPDIVVEEPLPEEHGTQPELDAMVHNQEGLRHYRAGELGAALQQFQLARELAPENTEYAYNYAVALRQARLPEEAARELERVLRFEPRRAGAHFNLGMARLEMGDSAAARQSLERAVELSTVPAERAAALREISRLDAARATPPVVDTVAPRDTFPPADR